MIREKTQNENPSITNIIEFATIATRGNATNFGDLTQARRGVSGASSSVRACFSGGSTPSSVLTIDYIEIATGGNAVDFGDLIDDARKNTASVLTVMEVSDNGNIKN